MVIDTVGDMQRSDGGEDRSKVLNGETIPKRLEQSQESSGPGELLTQQLLCHSGDRLGSLGSSGVAVTGGCTGGCPGEFRYAHARAFLSSSFLTLLS